MAFGGSAEPQGVLTPLTSSALFLVATVRPGGERQIHNLVADVSALQRSVGFRSAPQSLTCVTGFGSEVWDRLFSGPRPSQLRPFTPLQGSVHQAPSTPGDLLFHIRADHQHLCFEFVAALSERLAGAVDIVDEVQAFRYFEQRDLLGFVDGTENPTGASADSAALVQGGAFAGGSYVAVQKYLHTMGEWNALPVEEQERVIGRTKLSDIELPDDVKPSNSHVALTTVTDDNGEERDIVRFNMPFGSPGRDEFGLYFIGYSATPDVTDTMLRNMFVGDPPGNHDRVLDFSIALTGTQFFAPSQDFMDDPPPLPAPGTADAVVTAIGDSSAADPAVPAGTEAIAVGAASGEGRAAGADGAVSGAERTAGIFSAAHDEGITAGAFSTASDEQPKSSNYSAATGAEPTPDAFSAATGGESPADSVVASTDSGADSTPELFHNAARCSEETSSTANATAHDHSLPIGDLKARES